MRIGRTAVAIFVLGLAGAAAWPAGAVDGYLAKGAAPDSISILPPPPAAGSVAEQQDIAAFTATRSLEGTPRWALATTDAEQSPEAAFVDFGCALGVVLDDGSAPTLSNLFARIQKDARAVVDPPKDHYARKRPYLLASGDICVDKTDALAKSGSYPSGHTTLSWAWGLILTELAPDRSTEILLRARAYGESRVVCGVHYPSDIEAGRTNGAGLVAALEGSAEFRADLEKARAELDAARKAGGPKPDAGRCDIERAAEAQVPWLPAQPAAAK
ncbi:MAG: phosphatase PAP2 family protein [Caulobacteraceae bacterium]